MAKLSSHKGEVGRLEFVSSLKAFMADGTIMKNHGFGWKLYGKIKAGYTPEQVYETQRQYQIDRRHDFPCQGEWARAVIAAACISKRWKLVTAIELMPDDPDGVWSETCDDGSYDSLDLTLDEVVKLCRLYNAAQQEKIYHETHKNGLPEE